MRNFAYILLVALVVLGGCVNPAADGNTVDPTNNEKTGNAEEFAHATVSTTIGGEPESCGAVAETEDGEVIDEGSTDPNSDNYGLALFADEPFVIWAGNNDPAIADRAGDPRHVKNVDGENWFYTSNPIEDELEDSEEKHYEVALHRSFDGTATCIENFWWWDDDAPDHKGERGRVDDEHESSDIQVKGEATFIDPVTKETMTGVKLITDETAGNLASEGSGGMWVIVNDHLYLQPREGVNIRVITSALNGSSFSFTTESEGLGVREFACTVE